MRHLPRFALLLLLALTLAPFGLPTSTPGTARAAHSEPPTLEPAQAPPTLLPPYRENEPADPNDEPASADTIGSAETQRWRQLVEGRIGSSTDIDYYTFTLTQPASSVELTLDGLTADYDLVLAGGPTPGESFDAGQGGLEGVTEIGSQISAIGSQISAIGSQISAIGSQISAIGSQISAIGSQISAISAQSGTSPEQIETFLWLPGTYYAVVAPSNGQFSDTAYTLTVQVDGSGLQPAPPVPDVELRLPAPTQATPAEITTLYIINSARMAQLYPGQATEVFSITTALDSLANFPPSPNGAGAEFGYVLDLADLQPIAPNTRTITDVYTLWASNQSNPLYANFLAGIIDNVIEAVRDDATPGSSVSPEECPPLDPCPGSAAFLLGDSRNNLTVFPNVRNVVLVGGDEVLPFFRLPDLTTIANEADYAAYLRTIDPSGIIGTNNPLGAALRYRMILSDNPYGSGRPYKFYGYPYFVPGLAVGRLVESPAEINNYLENYTSSFLTPSFVVDASGDLEGAKAVVTGYDFLKDQAEVISATLASTGLVSPTFGYNGINYLNSDTWTSTDLTTAWFDGPIDTRFPDNTTNDPFADITINLASLNAHFDHWQLLPAVGTNGNFPARRLLTPGYGTTRSSPPGGYFRESLAYSVGCHSGYNVIDKAIVAGTANEALYQADFAQAYNRHAGNWIGNTGYGYGTADGIDYSERLAVLLTQEFAREVLAGDNIYVGQSIGEALRNAKQRYTRNATSLGPYDYKVTHIKTLYGLPYVRVVVSDPLAPPPEDPAPSRGTPLETQAPTLPNARGLLTRTITFELDLDDPDDFSTITRGAVTIGQVINLDEGDFTVRDDFVALSGGAFPQPSVRVFANNQAGTPSLPTFAYDISAASGLDASSRLTVKDVVFLGGTYGQITSFNPQVTQIVTETDTPIVATGTEPSFEAGAGIWYPDKFFGFSSVGEGEQQRDQLTAAAAQFRADDNGVSGMLRPYSRMVFQVIYDDPGATGAAAAAARQDNQPPLIESVRVQFVPPGGTQAAQSSQATLLVTAYDEGDDVDGQGTNQGLDLDGISATYIVNGTTWQRASFVQLGPQRFAAQLNVAQGSVRVIVRVTDRAGNSSYYTAKGTFTPPLDRTLVRLPLLQR
ncbi:MAG: peptidase [Chloroflexi bacterium OHK40]